MPEPLLVYGKQEHLAPGAARTVELLAEAISPGEDTLLLDAVAVKGEAACTLAGRFACRVLALETYDPFVHYAAAKAWHWNLRDLATVGRGRPDRLPLPDAVCDVACCLGGPSNFGREESLAELARVLKPNGHLFVSDAVRRAEPASGPTPAWLGDAALTAAEYVAAIAGLRLTAPEVTVHDRDAWEERWRPMLQVAHEAKVNQPADIDFADEVETMVEAERRAVDTYLDYLTFWARKPER